MKGIEGSLLTERQLEVMKLRAQGMTQQKVADRLGTSKSNVSALEIAAQKNIERARKTLEVAARTRALLRVEIPSGTDVNDVPTLVYSKADDNGVRLLESGPVIISRMMGDVNDRIRGRLVVSPFEVTISENGEIQFS
jgi:hypothetical protein